ncbi:MAG: tetratricopeptide repeat protein [Rhodospirillales bacterium]
MAADHFPFVGQQENSMQMLDAADELLRAGRFGEAETLCRRIVEREPDNAEAHYFLGLIAFEGNALDRSERHLSRAVSLIPDDPVFLCNLGNVQHARGDLVASEKSFREAVRYDDTLSQAHANLGLVLTQIGKLDEGISELQKALSFNPEDVEAHLNLGNALREQNAFRDAIVHYRRAIELAPDYDQAHRNMGVALAQTGKFDEAVASLRRSLELQPQSTHAFTELGLILIEAGKLEEAAEHLIGPVCAFRSVRERPPEEFPEFDKINKTKLTHDIEQLEYLLDRRKVSADHRALVADYKDALNRLGEHYEGKLSAFDPPASVRLRSSYNRILYHAPAAQVPGGALSPGLDLAKIENDFLTSEHGFAFFDGLLKEEALTALHAFCLDSTIWCLLDYPDELESNLLTGFACPLIFQIATDIKAAFPKIFGPHAFSSCWAYKYFQRKSGLGVHCDDGAVSINFWITPDEANNDPDAGGLVMWNKKVPRDFLGEMTEERQERFKRVLNEPDAQSFRVPYGCNRAVLFHSNVLHGTDAIDFKPGYENNRINMTFLYGKAPKGVSG